MPLARFLKHEVPCQENHESFALTFSSSFHSSGTKTAEDSVFLIIKSPPLMLIIFYTIILQCNIQKH